MFTRAFPVFVLGVIIGAALAIAVAYYAWGPARPLTANKVLPSPRSHTVPEGFAPIGLEGEVRDILLEPDTFKRTEALAKLLPTLGEDALEDVRRAYSNVLLDLDDTELVLFGEWWARFDPRAALLWTDHHWGARNSIPVGRGIMREWGRSDPEEAIVIASARSGNDTQRLRWIDSVLRGWDESVVDGALEYAKSLPPGPERQWALTTVTRRRVMRDGPEAVIQWAEGLPELDKMFKLNAYRRVAGSVAEVDPDLAIAFAEKHLEGEFGDGLPERVGRRLVKREPEKTMLWLRSLPPSENRDSGVMNTYRTWIRFDRAAAQAWLPTVEREVWLDPAVAIYAKSISKQDPPKALEWSRSIAEPALRDRITGVIARNWLSWDYAAADAWLAQAGLDEKLERRIRGRAQPAPLSPEKPS